MVATVRTKNMILLSALLLCLTNSAGVQGTLSLLIQHGIAYAQNGLLYMSAWMFAYGDQRS